MNTLPKPLRIILLCFVVYSAAFIYRSSFVIESTRYFCLFDDAMISMQYAQNLAHGNGLTWNAHEKIEGITNPLWTFGMALLHLCPIPLQYTSLIVQIGACLCMMVQCILIWKISNRIFPKNQNIALIATLCTATYYPILYWSLLGMEVSLCVVIVTFVLSRIHQYEHTSTIPWMEIIILAVSTCIRIDMIVPGIVLICALAVRAQSLHKTTLITGLLACVGMIALQTALRYWYYGEVLPNTYYLKMTGISPVLRISRGIFSAVKFIVFFNPLLIIIPLLYLRKKYNITLYTICALFLGQIGYSMYVGGDAWDWFGGANRYVSLAISPFFIVMSAGLYHVFLQIQRRFPFFENHRRFLFPVGIILLLFQINFQNNGKFLTSWLLIAQPPGTQDNKSNIEIALLLRETGEHTRIATVTAGVVHYFVQRKMIDILGKNDVYIAHLPCHIPKNKNKYISFHPGHNKYDYRYSLQQQKPDIIIGIDENNAELIPFLQHYRRDNYKNNILYSRYNSDDLTHYYKKIHNSIERQEDI